MITRCSSCYYGNACTVDGNCPYYDCVAAAEDGDDMNTYIEELREEYRREVYRDVLQSLFEDDYSNAEF